MRWCAILLSVAVASVSALAAQPVITKQPERDGQGPATVGDRVQYRVPNLILTVPPGDVLRVRLDEKEKVGWFLDDGAVGYDDKAGVLTYALVPLRGGAVKTPTLEVVTKDGDVYARVGPVDLTVNAVRKGPDDKPPELVGPLSVPVSRFALIFSLLLIAGLIGALVVAAIWLWKRRQPKPKAAVTPDGPRLTLEEEICGRLKSLEAERYWERGQYKSLYFGVSEILKEFLGRRFGFDALESTTGELLLQMQKYGVSDDVIREVDRFFRKLDVVKFTDLAPSNEEARLLAADAMKFVRANRPPPPVQPSPDSAGGPRAV